MEDVRISQEFQRPYCFSFVAGGFVPPSVSKLSGRNGQKSLVAVRTLRAFYA